MKKITTFHKAAFGITAFLLVGAVVGSTTFAQQKTPITIWWPQGDNERKALEQAIEDYKKVAPDVEIKPIWQAGSDDLQKLLVSYAGGDAPDLARMDSVYVPSLGTQGVFADLTKYGAGSLKANYFTPVWNANVLNNAVYGLPFDCSTLMLMYNPKLLAETKTRVPRTYDELIAAAKANTRDTNGDGKIDVWGYTVPNSALLSGWVQYQYVNWIWRLGGDVLSADGKKAVFNSPAAVKALEMLVAPSKSLKVAPDNAYYEQQFYSGSVAFMDMGPWALNGRQDKGFSYTPLPRLDPKIPTTTSLGSYSIGLFSTSKQPDAAYKFLRFFSSTPKYQVDFAQRTFLLSSLRAAYNDPRMKKAPWSTFQQTLPSARARPSTAVWPQIADFMAQAITNAFLGKDAQASLDEAVAKTNDVLAKQK